MGKSNQDAKERRKEGTDDHEDSWVKEMRGWIMVVAVQVAGAAYTAGLNPPGGFWQDDTNPRHRAHNATIQHDGGGAGNATYGHIAGNAVLHDEYYNRYLTFFYANATAFMASLVIIILLTNKEFASSLYKVFFLEIIMVLDLVSLMIAYAAGCARSVRTSVYVFVLAVAVLLFVIVSAQNLQSFLGKIRYLPKWLKHICPLPSNGGGSRSNTIVTIE